MDHRTSRLGALLLAPYDSEAQIAPVLGQCLANPILRRESARLIDAGMVDMVRDAVESGPVSAGNFPVLLGNYRENQDSRGHLQICIAQNTQKTEGRSEIPCVLNRELNSGKQ